MASDNAEMTLRDYARVVERRKWIVIVAVLLATIVALWPLRPADTDLLGLVRSAHPATRPGRALREPGRRPQRAGDPDRDPGDRGRGRPRRVQADLGSGRRHRPASTHRAPARPTSIVAQRPRRQRRQRPDLRQRLRRGLHRRPPRSRRCTNCSPRAPRCRPRSTACRSRSTPSPEDDPRRTALFAQLVELQHHARPTARRRRAAHRRRHHHPHGRTADRSRRADAGSHRRARRRRRSADRARRGVPRRLPRRQGPWGGRPRSGSPTAGARRAAHRPADRPSARVAQPPRPRVGRGVPRVAHQPAVPRARPTDPLDPTHQLDGGRGQDHRVDQPRRRARPGRPPRRARRLRPAPTPRARGVRHRADPRLHRPAARRRRRRRSCTTSRSTTAHRLSVYTAGAVPSNPSEMLGGRRAQRLLPRWPTTTTT